MCSSAAFHAQFDFRAILVLPIFFYHFAFLKRKGAYKRNQKKTKQREKVRIIAMGFIKWLLVICDVILYIKDTYVM